MERENELWDDSALVNAFDQALTKYKMMHSSNTHVKTIKGEKSTNYMNDTSTEGIHENVEPDDEGNNAMEATTDSNVPHKNHETACELSPIQESQPEEGTCFPESNPELAGATSTHNKVNGYEEAEYNNLLCQYYEVEEKRQKILRQLQQVGHWNYPSSTQYQTPQVDQGTDTSHVGLLSPCCMCLGHCCACAVSSSSCGSFCPWDAYKSLSLTHQISADGQCPVASTNKFETTGQSSHTNSSVEMAKAAAASSMSFEASVSPNVYKGLHGHTEEKGKRREATSGVHGGQVSLTVDLETDLTMVLNAWYSAGFYTGRYLLEKSMKNCPR